MAYAIPFGLGVGLIYLSLFIIKDPPKSFKARSEETWLESLIRPFTYFTVYRFLIRYFGSNKNIDELLMKAGRPWGLKSQHVTAIRIILPIIVASGFLGAYMLGFTKRSIQAIIMSNVGNPVYVSSSGSVFVIAITLALISVLLYYLPILILSEVAKVREERYVEDFKIFNDLLFLSLKDGNMSVYKSLELASKSTKFLRPYINKCLQSWPNDRIRALTVLGEEVGFKSFITITNLLIQFINTGEKNIPDFLAQNARTEEKLRLLEVEKRSAILPVIGTVQMALPFFIVLVVMFYPLLKQMQSIILFN